MTQNSDAHPGEPVTLSRLRAGTLVGGYRLVRRLGAGGMGVVWEAVDEGGRHVAMKILHPQIAADPTARRRLEREASVLARVRDTRVARILDIETGDGSLSITFVITELVEGPTLQHEVEHEGVYDLTTDARDLADLAHGLVDSLRAVHSAGVIHRDLKPSNVMLSAQGPVLIDFGIAQVADDVRLTQTGQVTGTPGFIPPEMLDGGEPTVDVDWYACAGVLLFTVTGIAPFGSGAWQVVFRRVYAGTPELGDLEQENPALARAFTAALAPEVENRLEPDGLLEVLDEIAEGGSGQEAVDRLLGPEEPEDGSEESETSTSTFVPGYGTTPGYDVATGYGLQRNNGSAPSTSPAAYGSPVSAGSAAEGGYGYGAPSVSSAAPVQPPPAIPPRSWYWNSGSMPTGQAQPMQYGVAAPAPVAPSETHPQSSPSRQVLGSPYSGYRSMAPQPTYPQSATAPAGVPASGSMTGPMMTSTQPAQVLRFRAPTGTGDLPQWAQEPERHPMMLLAFGFTLSAVGIMRPGWIAIIAAILTLIAGTVGRAQDARRWKRLQLGVASPADTSRMWVATPWYLLRSLLATGFAVMIALIVGIFFFYVIGTNVAGLGTDTSTTSATSSMSVSNTLSLLLISTMALYLLTLWLIPWGASTRRGGAHIINMIAPNPLRRTSICTSLMLIGLFTFALCFMGLSPQPSFTPFR